MKNKLIKHKNSKLKIKEINPRYLPQPLRDKLLVEADHRCCICPDHEDITEIHHILEVSDGGIGIYRNLIIVCPNCHAKIHREIGKYSPNQLKMYKEKWLERCKVEKKETGKLVPDPEITIKEIDTEKISIKLKINTQGKIWIIEVPWDIRTSELTIFITEKLGLDNTPFGSSHCNWELIVSDTTLDSRKTLRENGVKPNDTLRLCVYAELG